MKKSERIIALILALAVIFAVGACGNTGDDTPTTTESVQNAVVNNPETTLVQDSSDTTGSTGTTAPQTTANAGTTAPVTQAAAPAPSENNPPLTGVGSYKSTYAGIEQVVFYPNAITQSNQTYPVVVWANGTMVSYDIYVDLLKKIAEGGYIVVANTEKMPADGTAQIASMEFAISENGNSASVLCGKVNTDKIAAAGHSQGGRSAVNAAAADARFDCVFSVAGSNYTEEAEKLSAPVFFTAGTRDMIVNTDSWIIPAYDVVKGPAVYAALDGGLHTACSTSPEKYSGYAIKWFDLWLKNDLNAKSVFQAGGALSQDGAWVDFRCKGI